MEGGRRTGLMLYGADDSKRDAFTDDKYSALASCFAGHGNDVSTVTYRSDPTAASRIEDRASALDALLVWINRVEPGHDAQLFDTREMTWGSDFRICRSIDSFPWEFASPLEAGGTGQASIPPSRRSYFSKR